MSKTKSPSRAIRESGGSGLGLFPGDPRCLNCDAPLSEQSAPSVRFLGVRASSFSPRLCTQREDTVRKYEGGAELVLSMLFAGVRGSTALAVERMASDFSRLVQESYRISSDILVRHDALVNRLTGDQVIGLFVPRLTGLRQAHEAVLAARHIMQSAGHEDPKGLRIPVGAGVQRALPMWDQWAQARGYRKSPYWAKPYTCQLALPLMQLLERSS